MLNLTNTQSMNKQTKQDNGADIVGVCKDGILRMGKVDWEAGYPRLWVGNDLFEITYYEVVNKI